MLKLKRIISIGFSFVLMLCMSICFVGCRDSEAIELLPNGNYCAVYSSSGVKYAYFEEGKKLPTDHYLSIKNNKVIRYVSGFDDYRAKIVEKEDKLYFEGYTWKSILWGTQGNDNVYEIEYDEETKTIIMTLLKND